MAGKASCQQAFWKWWRGYVDKHTLTTIVLSHNSDSVQLEQLIKDTRKHCDEVILVDDFSNEDYRDLARKNGVIFLQHAVDGNFARHRNWALSQAGSDWVFFIDADEFCPAKLWQEIHAIIANNSADAIEVKRHDFFLNRTLKHGEVGNIRLLRCAKKKLGLGMWQRPVHEIWDVPTQNISRTSTALRHNPHPDIKSFLNKLNWYASLEPASRGEYSLLRIIFEFICYPLAKWIHNYIFRLGFLDGRAGLIHASCMSYYSLITRVFIYEANFTKHN